jgi:hypothetical protein
VLGLPIAEGEKIQTLAKVIIDKFIPKIELSDKFRGFAMGYADKTQAKSNG